MTETPAIPRPTPQLAPAPLGVQEVTVVVGSPLKTSTAARDWGARVSVFLGDPASVAYARFTVAAVGFGLRMLRYSSVVLAVEPAAKSHQLDRAGAPTRSLD